MSDISELQKTGLTRKFYVKNAIELKQKYPAKEKYIDDMIQHYIGRLSNEKYDEDGLLFKPYLEEIKEHLEIIEEKKEKKPLKSQAKDMKELFSGKEEKEDPILKKYIYEKSIATIFGDTGSLKSIFTDYLACCIATGSKFLGRFPVKKRAVLILSTENNERTDKKRLRAIFRGMNINPKRRSFNNLQLLICGRDKIDIFSNPVYYVSLKNELAERKTKVLIIDTISPMIMDTNDNNASEVVRTFKDYLFPLVDEFGLSIILIMHSQKTGKDFLGSIKHKASVECFYELSRDEDTLQLLSHKAREGEYNLKIKTNFIEKKETLHKITFEFLEEWKGKQSAKDKENNPAKTQLAEDCIFSLLKEKELRWNEMIEGCVSSGISKTTAVRTAGKLYQNKKIKKKAGKTGGYYIA